MSNPSTPPSSCCPEHIIVWYFLTSLLLVLNKYFLDLIQFSNPRTDDSD